MTPLLELERVTLEVPPSRQLEKIWVAFVKLQRLRQEIMADFAIDDTGKNASCVNLDEAVFIPITNELHLLARRAATVEAQSREDLEYKAVILSEFLPLEDCTIHTSLAKSLVNDIKKNMRQADPSSTSAQLHHGTTANLDA